MNCIVDNFNRSFEAESLGSHVPDLFLDSRRVRYARSWTGPPYIMSRSVLVSSIHGFSFQKGSFDL